MESSQFHGGPSAWAHRRTTIIYYLNTWLKIFIFIWFLLCIVMQSLKLRNLIEIKIFCLWKNVKILISWLKTNSASNWGIPIENEASGWNKYGDKYYFFFLQRRCQFSCSQFFFNLFIFVVIPRKRILYYIYIFMCI